MTSETLMVKPRFDLDAYRHDRSTRHDLRFTNISDDTVMIEQTVKPMLILRQVAESARAGNESVSNLLHIESGEHCAPFLTKLPNGIAQNRRVWRKRRPGLSKIRTDKVCAHSLLD
jgi:hypothetical protein